MATWLSKQELSLKFLDNIFPRAFLEVVFKTNPKLYHNSGQVVQCLVTFFRLSGWSGSPGSSGCLNWFATLLASSRCLPR